MRWIYIVTTILAFTPSQSFASATARQISRAGAAPQTVGVEPGPHTLSRGQIIYVDDHSCPAGQIKMVIGGSNGSGRERSCVNH